MFGRVAEAIRPPRGLGPVRKRRRPMLPELPGFPALPLLERRQNLLAAFKARHAHTSWDAAVAALLAGADRQ